MSARQIVVSGHQWLRDEDDHIVGGLLLRTFDGGETWELCLRIRGRWSAGQPVAVVEEALDA